MHKPTSNSHPSFKSTYQPEIDGLRALAVIVIIINHFNKNLLPGGYLGVDMFFVISGYVITSSLAKRSAKTFAEFFSGFYTRRIKRLVPALAICVVVTSFLICLLNPNPGVSLRTGLYSLFGFSNLFLWHKAADYFATSSEANVFTQTWSLGIEEQFYLIFPFLVWISGLGRSHHGAKKLFWIVLAISLASVCMAIHLQNTNTSAAYFLMPARFWELGAGCLLFLALDKNPREQANIWSGKFSLIIAAAIVVSFFITSKFTVHATVLIVILTMLMIAAIRPGTLCHTVLTNPVIVYIGKISYSLYLWHWTVLSISRWTFGIHWWTVPFQIVLMFLLAIFSFHLVEKPLRHAEWTYKRGYLRLGTISIGLCITLLSALMCAGLLTGHKKLFYSGSSTIATAPDFYPMIGSGQAFETTCVVDAHNRPYTPEKFNLCTVAPKPQHKQTIWALGDSHAGHLQGLLYALHDSSGVGVHLIETLGIPFPLPKGVKLVARDEIYQRIMEQAAAGDIILLARLFIDRSTGKLMDDVPDWNADVLALAKNLATKKISVVIVGPPPNFRFEDIASCRVSLWSHIPCAVERQDIAPAIDAAYASLENIASKQNNLFIFNQFDYFCPKSYTVCTPVKDNAYVFRDKDHLNSRGAASLAPPFLAWLHQQNLLKFTNAEKSQ